MSLQHTSVLPAHCLWLGTSRLVGSGEDPLEMESDGLRSSFPPERLLVSLQMALCRSEAPVVLPVAARVSWSRL